MTKHAKETNLNIVSRAEFARLQGVGRARISQLAKDGRLVLAENGKDVYVVESLARIEATRDPSKIGTVKRHATKRAMKSMQNIDDSDKLNTLDNTANIVEGSYHDYKTKHEKYKAAKAKQEFEQSTGKLLLVDDVLNVVTNAVQIIRSRFEMQPEILASRLATESDPNRIKSIMLDYNESFLTELSQIFEKLSINEQQQIASEI